MVWNMSYGLRCLYPTISPNRDTVASVLTLALLDTFKTNISLWIDSNGPPNNTWLPLFIFQPNINPKDFPFYR